MRLFFSKNFWEGKKPFIILVVVSVLFLLKPLVKLMDRIFFLFSLPINLIGDGFNKRKEKGFDPYYFASKLVVFTTFKGNKAIDYVHPIPIPSYHHLSPYLFFDFYLTFLHNILQTWGVGMLC